MPVVAPESWRLLGVVTDRGLCLDVVASGKDPKDVQVAKSLHGNTTTCRMNDDIELCLETAVGGSISTKRIQCDARSEKAQRATGVEEP